jgi:hypothetical protein
MNKAGWSSILVAAILFALSVSADGQQPKKIPAGCRPDSYRSGTERYFPLMEEEKQFLLTLYPPTWKWRQEKRSRPLFYPSDPK